MKSRLPISEYPKAWKEYNRRWYAAWIGLLALILYIIVAMICLIHDHWVLMCVLIAPAVLVFLILYSWFDGWPCPRCGVAFTSLRSKLPVRSEICFFCGLRRNAVSNFDDIYNEKTWQEANFEDDEE
jgi:hypothetical protein